MMLYTLNDTAIVVLQPEDTSLAAPIAVQVTIKSAGYALVREKSESKKTDPLVERNLQTTWPISSTPNARYR